MRNGYYQFSFEKLPEGAVTRGRTSVDVCALGGIVLVEALVCKRQRPPQFPLRPYTRRVRLVLMLAKGESYATVQAALGCDPGYVSRWKRRFEAERLAGLYSRHRGSKARVLTPKLQARILEKTRQKPLDGSTHWSTRRLAEAMGINLSTLLTLPGRNVKTPVVSQSVTSEALPRMDK